MERLCIGFASPGFDSWLSSCSSSMTMGMQPMEETHAGAGGCGEETVNLWEAQVGGDSWQDLQTQGQRSPDWTRFPGGTCNPLGDSWCSRLSLKSRLYPMEEWTILQQFTENCCPWDGLALEKLTENYLLWEGPCPEAGGRPFFLSSSRNNYHNPHPSPVSLGLCRGAGRVGEEVGWKGNFEYLFHFS